MPNSHPKVLSTAMVFVVSDLQRSVDFYCQKLGFCEPALWGDPPCFAIMNRDSFDLMLSLAESKADIHPNGPKHIWDLAIRVINLEAEIAALRSAGVALDRGPTKTEYCMVEIEVVDPDGYRICLGQNLEEEPEA